MGYLIAFLSIPSHRNQPRQKVNAGTRENPWKNFHASKGHDWISNLGLGQVHK